MGIPREQLWPLPLDCIDLTPGSTTIGVVCESCPFTSIDIGCPALRAAGVIVEQRREISVLTEANQARQWENTLLLERLFNLRLDVLVGSAFTPEGLRDHLTYDNEIQEELCRGNWGAIRIDGRFVNYINRFGMEIGDEFLASGGQEIAFITDGLVRVQPRRRQQEAVEQELRKEGAIDRRQGQPVTYDIICRQGGDEFALLVRNIDAPLLARVAARVRNQLTVAQALDRYGNGQVPFIASVGYAHASASEIAPEVTGLITRNDFWNAFRKVSALADEGQRRAKATQYDEMWEITVASMPPEQRPVTVTRPNDREVAEAFLRIMCPDFMANPLPYLVRNRQEDRLN